MGRRFFYGGGPHSKYLGPLFLVILVAYYVAVDKNLRLKIGEHSITS